MSMDGEMNRWLYIDGATYELGDGGVSSMAFSDERLACCFLGAFLRDPHAMVQLRELADADALGGRLEDHEALERVARMLVQGRLCIASHRPPPPPSGPPPEAEETAPPPPSSGATQQALSWLGVELVDPDGRPVPAERYEVTLADGTKRSGFLNSQGTARLSEVPPGTHTLSFPFLDERDWG